MLTHYILNELYFENDCSIIYYIGRKYNEKKV